MKKIKIVATIGPATSNKEMISKLMDAGVDTMRLNFSHGTHTDHLKVINTIKETRKEKGLAVAILLDTKGPEIRTGQFKKEVELKEGNEFIIHTTEQDGNEKGCSVTYEGIINDVKVKDIILIDDGLISLTVTKVNKDSIVTVINNSAPISSYKGVNLPNAQVSLPTLSQKDKDDLIFGCKNDVDYVAASFIQSAKDVKDIRKFLDDNNGKDIWIISKIESQSGIDNFDSILVESDGIMVARGDLGVEIPLEDVPFRQKEMIDKANAAYKIIITATQMLESMTSNPRPTRAEVADIANAVLDGTDAVMLSGETAKGEYPIEAVEVMDRIAHKADQHVEAVSNKELPKITTYIEDAESLDVQAIVAITMNGRSVLKMRSNFPSMPVLAITLNEHRRYQLNMARGISPVLASEKDISKDCIVATATKHLLELNLIKKGDKFALISSNNPMQKNPKNEFEIIAV